MVWDGNYGRDGIKWEGKLYADYFIGDGTGITGITTTETDPHFMALSGAFLTDGSLYAISGAILTEVDPAFMALSGAFLTGETDPHFMNLSGAWTIKTSGDVNHNATTNYVAAQHITASAFAVSGALLDGSLYAISGAILTETDPHFIALSGAFTQQTYSTDLSGAHAVTSGAATAHINTTTIHQAATLFAVSGAVPIVAASHAATSSAYFIHAADTSDPHGAAITQTSMAIIGDNDASGAAVVRNILIGTEASPGDASNWTQGTVYLQYTA